MLFLLKYRYSRFHTTVLSMIYYIPAGLRNEQEVINCTSTSCNKKRSEEKEKRAVAACVYGLQFRSESPPCGRDKSLNGI
jgi:hypothetical protein